MAIFSGKDRKAEAEQKLLEAVEKGDTDLVRKALAGGVSPNCRDSGGGTPLHAAAFEGRGAIVTALLGAGANVNARTPDGATPLLLACATAVENEPIVAALLQAGADPDLAFTAGENVGTGPLHFAALGGKTAVVRLLVAKGAKLEARTGAGITPVMAAANSGSADVLAMLLDAGADPEARNVQGLTSLHLAASNGQLATTSLLLDRGVVVDARDKGGETPLHRASCVPSEPVVAALLANGAEVDARADNGMTPLYGAAMKGDQGVIKLLLQSGADPTVRSEEGQTPLDASVDNKAVRKLLKDAMKAAPSEEAVSEYWERVRENVRSYDGEELGKLIRKGALFAALPPERRLFLAAAAGNSRKVRELAAAGAPLDWQADDLDMQTSLSAAARRGDVKMLSTLVGLGAGVDAQRPDGGSALMDAAFHGQRDAVEELIRLGANVNLRGNNSRTAVLLAASESHDEIVAVLVKAGAGLDHVLANGLSCIAAALQKKNLGLARTLLESGANPTATNAKGFSALGALAIQNADVDLLRVLATRGLRFDDPPAQRDAILELAAERAEQEVVDFLRSLGIDAPDVNIDHQDSNGYTPLISAVLAKDEARVRKFLELGADTGLRDVDRETALSLAIDLNRKALIDILRQHKAQTGDYATLDPVAAMLQAAADGALGSILDLKDNGVSLNVLDADGNTPLMLATQAGHHGVVRALCRMEAFINTRNNAGMSAYKLTTAKNDEDIVRTLKEFSARDARDESGSIPLSLGDFWHGRLTRPGKDTEREADEEEGGGLAALFARALGEALECKSDSSEEKEPEGGQDSEPSEALVAAFNGDLTALERLASQGADLEAPYLKGLLPIHVAAMKGHGEVVDFLARAKVDLDRPDVKGGTAVVHAIRSGDAVIVEQLLGLGARADVAFRATADDEEFDGMTPLILAAEEGHAEICKLLIDRGAPISAMNGIGYTALMSAIKSDDEPTIDLLLERGADPDPIIVQQTHAVAKFNPLTLAATRGQTQTVLKLLERKVRVDEQDGNGWTALKHAVGTGNSELVDLLLAHQANFRISDREGWQAIHNAAAKGDEAILTALLEAGADPNAPIGGERFDQIGVTPLMLVAGNGVDDVARLLLDRGADIDRQSSAQLTALCNAINRGEIGTAKMLVASGADPRVGLAEDLPALQLACAGYFAVVREGEGGEDELEELVDMLLERGADPRREVDGEDVVEWLTNRGIERLPRGLQEMRA